MQEMLSEFFAGKNLNKRLNPDEAVAIGATVLAGVLSGGQNMANRMNIRFGDVIPHSLGVYVQQGGGIMEVMLNKNTKIPASFTEQYCPSYDN